MQIHEDKQEQHTASDRLQRSSCYRKTGHPMMRGGYQGWTETETADTLNVYDNSEMRTPIVIVTPMPDMGNMQKSKPLNA